MDFAPVLPIETERLRLRAFTRGDVDAVFEYRSREDVTRYLFDDPMTREACAEAVQARVGYVSLAQDGDRLFLAVERRDSGAMIGEVILILRSAESRQAELGYVFHPAHFGVGFATEAAGRLLALGFDEAGFHRIYARCHGGNRASLGVMRRLGMRQEAHFREHAFVKGRWDEEIICAMLEDEWRTRSGE